MKKKRFVAPSLFAVELQANNMMAVSLLGDRYADPDGEVLTKENDDWELWDDEDESFIPKNPKYFN